MCKVERELSSVKVIVVAVVMVTAMECEMEFVM